MKEKNKPKIKSFVGKNSSTDCQFASSALRYPVPSSALFWELPGHEHYFDTACIHGRIKLIHLTFIECIW
jgi:hypothetical protein